ncbi:probable G-protein coupled receptor Mth-like 1 isoform X2 [Nasonia vitripennis]|uniref:G-protein coupled receptors family 2 profile 2 domain-containing protein n=1 Tax=Nasonia vitripennis TaxID=7425 RepID=A0A7M7G766_NASVI|nr:probable G-protein coupled receptor Mth-like 1 isoform X2 [Nasonia vitripennis]
MAVMARVPMLAALMLLLSLHLGLGVEVPEGPNVPVTSSSDGDDITILHCCQPGYDLLSETNQTCVKSANSYYTEVYSPAKQSLVSFASTGWSTRYGIRPVCAGSSSLHFLKASKIDPFTLDEDNGNLLYELRIFVPTNQYCVGLAHALACLPNNDESFQAAATMRPRIRKCCGNNADYIDSKNSCEVSGSSSTLEDEREQLLGNNNHNGSSDNHTAGMEIISGFPVCQEQADNFTILAELRDTLLLPNASLLVNEQLVPSEEFCIERIRHNGKQGQHAKVFACSKHASKGSGPEAKDIRFTLYPVGFIISAIFLAATLATGFLLPASHHVLHWRCQTYHVACLMFGDITMAAIQLAGNSLKGDDWICPFLAIMAHFCFLATFFWLNTMCFNIWWTFRDLRPASLEKGQELLRLRFYGAYAWGGPLIVAGLAIFLDNLPETPGETFLRPHFGQKMCWFADDMEILAYFYGPIGVLLAINLIFFAATARELTCGLWKGEFVKSTTERAALGKVCLKLVVVMGVPWIFEVISWMAGGPAFLWYVTDLCNAAQGVLIFIVVGCQPQVRAALKRFWSRNPRANANRQGNGLSTTSHGMPSMGDSVTQNPSTKTAPLETIC